MTRYNAPEREKELIALADIVSSIMNVDVTKNTRKREYLYGRYMFFKLAKDCLGVPYQDIGWVGGRRDHASVHHGLKQFDMLLWPDKLYKEKYMLCVSVANDYIVNSKVKKDDFSKFVEVCKDNELLRRENQELSIKSQNARAALTESEERLLKIYSELPERLQEDVMFKVETAYKINEKHKQQLNVIYTEL